ncbi:MAG: hypothetical protein ACYC1M_07495 [Armatimonadota bacterium]
MNLLVKGLLVCAVMTASISAFAQRDISSEVLIDSKKSSTKPAMTKQQLAAQQMWRMRTRKWFMGGKDSGALHVMGNGKMVAFGRGADLAALHAPPISSPSMLSIVTKTNGVTQDDAMRIDGSAIWSHDVTSGTKGLLKYTEFVSSEFSAYIRIFECANEGVKWQIIPAEKAKVSNITRIANAWMITLNAGQKMADGFTPLTSYAWVIPNGSCLIEMTPEGELTVTPKTGTGSLAIVADSDYPSGVQTAERIASYSVAPLMPATGRYWDQFTQRRLAKMDSVNLDKDAASVLDSVAVTLKCMQGDDGGVAASEKWMMADTRQQYAITRTMLLLGMLDEARSMVRYRIDKFAKFGDLRSGESINTSLYRWRHENENTDITSSIILQLRDYYRATQDREMLRSAWPLLKYCWDAQIEQIAQGQLPFNGGEPFIQNGFYPRTGLNQGSSDATLMFVEAGKWLCDWAVSEGFWTANKSSQNMAVVEQCRFQWRLSMLSSNVIYANSGEREANVGLPRFRWGACDTDCGFVGWCERASNNRYLCPECMQRVLPAAEKPPRMEIMTCSLLPIYLGSDILQEEDAKKVLEHIASLRLSNGHLPTASNKSDCLSADAGLLLFNYLYTNDTRSTEAFNQMMSQMDNSRNWPEVLNSSQNPRPETARLSTWSDAVCAEAMLRYMRSPASRQAN